MGTLGWSGVPGAGWGPWDRMGTLGQAGDPGAVGGPWAGWGPWAYLISAARPWGARGAGAALCPTTWGCAGAAARLHSCPGDFWPVPGGARLLAGPCGGSRDEDHVQVALPGAPSLLLPPHGPRRALGSAASSAGPARSSVPVPLPPSKLLPW